MHRLSKDDAFEEDAGFPDPRFPVKHLLARGRPEFNHPPYIHWHEALEILHVYRGVLFVRVGSASTILHRGDALLIGSGFPHVISFPQAGPAIYSVYLFQPQMISTAWGDAYQTEYLTTTLAAEQCMKVYIGLMTLETGRAGAAHYLGQLRRELQEQGPGYRLRSRGLLLLALGDMYQRYETQKRNLQQTEVGTDGVSRNGGSSAATGNLESALERLQAAFDYVKQHFQAALTLDHVARSVNMSKYHFCREFRRLTGSTFAQYLRDVRLNHAIHLLLNTDKTVTEIAAESGFASVSAFYGMFKRTMKCTPGEMRERGK